MQGWILYSKSEAELTSNDNGVCRLLESARERGISLQVYRPDEFELIVDSNSPRLFLHEKEVLLPDFVIPRLGAATSHHALMLIRLLELRGIYVCNTASSIEMVKDKMKIGLMLAAAGLPTPKTLLVNFPIDHAFIAKEIGFPLLIKNSSGSKGLGIYLCEDEKGFADLMALLETHASREVLLQSFVQSSYGRDLRIFVLGSKVVGCMERQSSTGFKANYTLGGKVTTYPLNPQIEALALSCAKLFGLEIAGIDLLFGETGFFICEANSSPGFKGMEQATGLDIASLILEHVIDRVCKKPALSNSV